MVDRLEVTSTAQIAGDVACKVLVVEAGALMCGKISMKGIEPEGKPRKSVMRKSTKSSKDQDMEDVSSANV